MRRYMDITGDDGNHREGVMPQSEDEWALTQAYWEMLPAATPESPAYI